MAPSSSHQHLYQRLLQDVDELCRKPYPNVEVYLRDDDLTRFCLILSPPGWGRMHLTVRRLESFPLLPPIVRMDSDVIHPNVFNDYICASILNTSEGYTPAYTLKSIAIQLLSFFGSESIEQDGSSVKINLDDYRKSFYGDCGSEDSFTDDFKCDKCQFGQQQQKTAKQTIPGAVYVATTPPTRRRRRKNINLTASPSSTGDATNTPGSIATAYMSAPARVGDDSDSTVHVDKVPNEILLAILNKVEDFEDIINFARAWNRISQIITKFDVIRERELQCFVLKKTYREVMLGVGVLGGSKGISSEFDLLSKQAYAELNVRKSVHNMFFDRWLPLPISRPHWSLVKKDAHATLESLKELGCVKYKDPTSAQVIYQFMTDIVVKLNNVEVGRRNDRNQSSSTLRHASDKAIESYFHLFHLLVCLATEDDSVVSAANRQLLRFQDGNRTKADIPNLGHLLVALLISDVEVTPELRKAIVTEAITRNVVWVLKDNPGLAYMEPDEVSAYRLNKTFQASRTSYRLLMFSELFRRTARPNNEPLANVRQELFNRHGGPPPGAATHVASEVRRLHGVNDFTHFMREMGFDAAPTAANFTKFLRRTLDDSVKAGYSRVPIHQSQALALRLRHDRTVGIQQGLRVVFNSWRREKGSLVLPQVRSSNLNFFPEKPGQGKMVDRGGNRDSRRGRR